MGDSLYRAIDSILQQDPSLVGQPNEASWTPLHLACEKRLLWRSNVASCEMILRLIKACPIAVSAKLQSGYKAKTPFHIACETNADMAVLEAMLRANPSLAAQSYYMDDATARSVSKYRKACHQTPLELLWNAQMRDLRFPSLKDSLAKMELLLRAAYRGTIQDDDPAKATNKQNRFPILCAACSIPCPRDYISRLLTNYQEQISLPDPQTGHFPLHLAIWNANDSDETTTYSAFLIERLIEYYPNACLIPFHQGSRVLPLHVLVADRGMTWHQGGVRAVACAAVSVLILPDPRSRLVPALASASHAHKSRLHLSTTFELLRLAPHILQDGFFGKKG